jgi:hypothetical protein
VGKLRARLATSSTDQEFQVHLAAGSEALRRSLSVCRRAGGRRSTGQADEAQRALQRTLTLIAGMKRLEPPIEESDMDTLVVGEEALKRLIGVCQRVSQSHGARRARETQRAVQQALRLVADLSGPLVDESDSTPDETRNEMIRRKREEARRLAREEERKARRGN